VFDTFHGDRTILFLHGNSCDHTFMAPQIEYFSPRFRVVAPDLRGHGASDKPDCAYTFARLSDDLAEMAGEMGLPPMNVVGHSMGGMVALELSHRHPGLVLTLACLDSTVLTPPGRPSRIHSLLDGLKSDAWRGYFRRYFEAAFESTDDPTRKQAILERMLSTPQHVVVSLFEQWRVADGAAAAQACRAPFLYVSSTRPRTDTAQLRELCPQLATGQVVGSGHFMTLEVPDQVNAMLERFLTINGL
jgi:pimeloyl-ACP methyl ester carboxylesterase